MPLDFRLGPINLPDWLTPEAFIQNVQPMLANVTTSAIATALGISWVYASHIRAGESARIQGTGGVGGG
jgi:hypothetical protein